MSRNLIEPSIFPPDDFFRLPGLFRRWELEQVIESDADFYVQSAGHDESGCSLFQIYRRPCDPSTGPGDDPTALARTVLDRATPRARRSSRRAS
jgi:hypothetical protein